MTVSKRVRFEVLRRDRHTCQYCGGKAPDVALAVDHVVPAALGGSDDPSNLVAACRDCNAGKTSIQPDSPFVQQVSEHAAAYALGLLDKMTQLRAQAEQREAWAADFLDMWEPWHYNEDQTQHIPLPPGWRKSVVRWYAMGLPRQVISEAICSAMTKQDLVRRDFGEFRYMAGIIWRTIDGLDIDHSLTDETVRTYTKAEAVKRMGEEYDRGYVAGMHDGAILESSDLVRQDLVALTCDGQHDHWALQEMARVRRAA